jgi:hypothetical protein
MKTIKSIALTGMTALTLSCAAFAQTTPPTNGAPVTQQAPKSTDPQDKSQGQDVSGNPQPPTSHTMQTPQSTGQNSGTGNNLVGGNSGQMANAQRTEFGMLDTNKRGYVTSDDAKNDQWLKSNFAKCDSNHDGHVTSAEYAACGK